MPERPAVRRLALAEIQQLAFGVRYEPQFKFMDEIGAVIDEILRADGTPFGPDTFTQTESLPSQYRLLNDKGDSWLVINAQDTILQMQVKTKDEAQVDELAEGFQEYILDPLRRIGRVKNIARYGVVFRFTEEKAASLENPPIKRYLSEFPNVNSLVMQFSRRLAVEEALAMKPVNDYRNAIYSVAQSESGEVQISIDYQEYFQPLLALADWDEKPFPTFVERGTEYVHDEFHQWFQKFAAVSEVA